MRLPNKDDPGGDREGSLPRDIVLAVLSEAGVNAEKLDLHPFYLLSQGDVMEAHPLDERVGGLLVRYIAREFGIPILEFYYDPLTGERRE